MKKYRDNKGFTLAELLIVVAIIAVLVAIAIPIFTSQLEKSRETTDAANIRSQYAEVMAQAITTGVDVNKDGSEFPKISLKQTKDAWQNSSLKDSLYSVFNKVVNDQNDNGAEPTAKGSAWVEYSCETDEVILHFSGSAVGTGEDKNQSLISNAVDLMNFLNKGSNTFEDGFTWQNGWGATNNYSLGKALVSGRGNEDIKNALKAQGESEAAAKAYRKNEEKSKYTQEYNDLKNDLVKKSGFDQLYGSYGAYTIISQTKQNSDTFPTNGSVEVTEYLVVEGQRPKDKNNPSNGYTIIGVRETTLEINNNKVTGGYSYKTEDWTVVPVDGGIFAR